MKTTTERFLFSKLPDDEKEKLVDEVVRWGLTIWHSTADDLRGYWLEQKSYETIFYTLRSEDGTLVGSTTIKLYRVHYEGKDVIVAKLGLGVSPEFRGNKFALRCLLNELLRYKAAHPLQPIYLFSTLIHPVTYKLCCDLLANRVYPHFNGPHDEAIEKMVTHLTELFGVEKADSPDPYVYKEKFSAIETKEATEYWLNNKRPEVRFYIEHCPTYHNSGDCIICLAKLDLTHLIPHMLGTLARNRIDKWRGRKHKFA
jgi:hypothetical protein